MSTITGSNGNDTLPGTDGNDIINSGNGDDTVNGGAGSDSLNGGAGNDTLDGGCGSDRLNGGSGNDTLVYCVSDYVSENSTSGTKDVYTGGSGMDTLEIHFTLAQWLEPTTQTQIAAYLAHLSTVTNAKTGEVSNGSASDFTFTFGSSTLTVQMMETLKILVDGVVQNPADAGVLACGDIGTATEDGPGVKIDVLHNDLIPDLVKGLALASGPAHGTATLVQPDTNYPSAWYFQYQANSTHFQYLAEGQTASDTFTYTVTDADGDTGTATVTVTITGTNDAPVVAGTVTGSATEDGSAVTLNALADSSDVDDGTTLTVVEVPDALPAGVGYDAATHSFTLDPSHAAYQHLAAGQTVDVTVNYGVSDGIATIPESMKFTITGTNDAPVITSNGGGATAALGVNENSTAVTTVTASDADDGATQTYSIVGGTDAARFTIDATTGALSFISAPNSEAPTDSNSDNVYNVTVRASDGALFDDQAIAVSVNDVNEFAVTTPTDTDAAADAVDENAAIGTVVGVTAFASDADATNNGVTYSLSSNSGGLFAIDATTGAVTVAGAIDRELDASLDITVRATSADGSTADQAFTIGVNDVNEFDVTTPTDTDAAANAVDENSAIGTVVGVTAFASDADATTNAVSYALTSNPGSLFAIDATTGVITTAAAIDREALGASVTIEVTATSADTSTAAQSFSIAINDVNEFSVTTPADTDAAADAVDENSAIGAVVGVTAFASDADATTNTVSYSLTDSAGGRFAIDATTGAVTVAGAIDRELDASLDITVRATSADGSTADQAFTIGVNDVNEFDVTTPTDTNAAADAVDENSVIGTLVGTTASSSDADATTNAVSYALTSNPGSLFAIDATTGVITTAAAIDREASGASVTIEVTATSADTSTAAQSFSIAINGLNDNTPTITSNGAGATASINVAENSTAVTTVSATDADLPAQTLTYSIVGGADAAGFAIDSSTGVLVFASAPNFDLPTDAGTNNVYDVTVRASDGTLFDDQALAVTVTNVNETPTDIVFTGTPPSAGNALPTPGQILAVLSTADPDVGDTFTYRFDTDGLGTLATTASSAGTTFTLTGATLTSSGLSTNTAYTLLVRSTDAGGLFVEETLNIITGSNGGKGDTLPTGGAGDPVAAGDDILYGLDGGNGSNRDILFGGTGNDTLYGQDGRDELHGGDGKDVLFGGAGNDTFFFDTALNAATNADTIKDFSTGSDHISLLKAGIFSNLTGSAGSTTLGTDFAASQTTAGNGAEHVFYDPATGNLYYDASAGSHADALVFATLTNTNGSHPTIASTDFIIS